MYERRQHSRIQASFPVECTMINSKNYFYTVTKDISHGGVQILTSNFVAKEDILKLALNFIDSLVTIKAKVAWCNKNRACERYSVGLEFVEVSSACKQNISRFVNSLS
jgi:c-di-GMP-binding flagellar brake protein YcgR